MSRLSNPAIGTGGRFLVIFVLFWSFPPPARAAAPNAPEGLAGFFSWLPGGAWAAAAAVLLLLLAASIIAHIGRHRKIRKLESETERLEKIARRAARRQKEVEDILNQLTLQRHFNA